jgi:hypothetical protein
MEQIIVTFHTLTTATTKIILLRNVTPFTRLGIYQGVKKNFLSFRMIYFEFIKTWQRCSKVLSKRL